MDSTIHRAVERAIVTMQDNVGEPLTVDDLARSAMFSKFHFTRIFRQVTGISPRRFLSALRLQQAKQLLVSTSQTVADISNIVGYNSVGTFSSRFARSVGLSPTVYRRHEGFAPQVLDAWQEEHGPPARATLHGHIHADSHGVPGIIFVGLFPGRIPEGRPVRCAVLSRPGRYQLDNVPMGSWYLLAQSIEPDLEYAYELSDAGRTVMHVGTRGPINVFEDTGTRTVDLRLKPPCAVDPPVLLALLDPYKVAMSARFGRDGGGLTAPANLGASASRAAPLGSLTAA